MAAGSKGLMFVRTHPDGAEGAIDAFRVEAVASVGQGLHSRVYLVDGREFDVQDPMSELVMAWQQAVG